MRSASARSAWMHLRTSSWVRPGTCLQHAQQQALSDILRAGCGHQLCCAPCLAMLASRELQLLCPHCRAEVTSAVQVL